MVRYVVFLILFWFAAYGLIGAAVDLAIGQDDPPRFSTGLDGAPCCYECECKGCKCDISAGRKCCTGCGCVFVSSCCCCTEEPPVFKVPADPVPLLPGIKKLPDGTYDLTDFFKAELRKKEAASKVVCGAACCCGPCECGAESKPAKERTVKRDRRKLFGVSGRFRFRKH